MCYSEQQTGTLRTFRAAACFAVVLALCWSPFAVPAASRALQDHASDLHARYWYVQSSTTRLTQPWLAAFAGNLPLTAWLLKAACGALGLISTTAAASSNKETRQILDWVAELAAAWTRCGVQLAVAVDIWYQLTNSTADAQAHQELQEQNYSSYAAAYPHVQQLPSDALQQVLSTTLLLNQTALHLLHPARELAAAAVECLLLLVNLAALNLRLQESLLLTTAPKLLVLAVVTRLGPPVLLGLWTPAWQSSSSASRLPVPWESRQQQQQRWQQQEQ
jgi:hypothetical protein